MIANFSAIELNFPKFVLHEMLMSPLSLLKYDYFFGQFCEKNLKLKLMYGLYRIR